MGLGFAMTFPRIHTDFPVPAKWGIACMIIGAVMVIVGYFLKKFLK
jgi:hypothetical protein